MPAATATRARHDRRTGTGPAVGAEGRALVSGRWVSHRRRATSGGGPSSQQAGWPRTPIYRPRRKCLPLLPGHRPAAPAPTNARASADPSGPRADLHRPHQGHSHHRRERRRAVAPSRSPAAASACASPPYSASPTSASISSSHPKPRPDAEPADRPHRFPQPTPPGSLPTSIYSSVPENSAPDPGNWLGSARIAASVSARDSSRSDKR